MAAPFFSVVVPTCDRWETLAATLERLAPGRQALPADNYEVIVTDDGASDATGRRLAAEFPWVRWFAGPRRGPAANRNHGAKQARGTWIAFTDDDCLPEPGWLAAFAQAIAAQPGVQVCEGRTYAERPRLHPLEVSPINDAGGNLWSCNFAVRRELFAEIGGFDERFPFASMEDSELNLRLKKKDISRAFVRDAGVLHPWRRIADWRKHFARQIESRLIFEEIHPGGGFLPWWRLAIVDVQLLYREQLPWLWNLRGEMLRLMPMLWWSMLVELYYAWRRPPAASFRRSAG